MTIEHYLVGVALVLGLIGGYWLAHSRKGRRSERPQAVHQILLPFTGTAISRRAVDAALRLARAESATLMPAYLATVPKRLPLDCSMPAEAANSVPRPRRSQSIPASSAVGPTAMRWSACSSARASTASSFRRRRSREPASPAATWSGCWTRRRPRCSSSAPVPTIAASSSGTAPRRPE